MTIKDPRDLVWHDSELPPIQKGGVLMVWMVREITERQYKNRIKYLKKKHPIYYKETYLPDPKDNGYLTRILSVFPTKNGWKVPSPTSNYDKVKYWAWLVK